MSSSLPLAGIRIVEIGQNVAAPFGAMVLADLGASVVKIEPPGGDDARHYSAKAGRDSSIVFEAFNRNKESVCLDLADEAQRQWLREFIRDSADVCIQSLRPGKADRLELGADALLPTAPQLIYCNLGAYGAHGPLSELPGYDPMIQAFSGIMSVTGEADRTPARVGVPLIDLGTGLWLCIGILAAINRRHSTGRGGVVDVSLLETALNWMTIHFGVHAATGATPKRAGSGIRGVAPNRAYDTADGQIMITALNDRLFSALAQALEHPEWLQDPELASSRERGKNRHRVNELVQAALMHRSRDEWVRRLRDAGVPCSPIHDTAEVAANAQVSALGILETIGELPAVLAALRFEHKRPGIRAAAPSLGEHNAKYLPQD